MTSSTLYAFPFLTTDRFCHSGSLVHSFSSCAAFLRRFRRCSRRGSGHEADEGNLHLQLVTGFLPEVGDLLVPLTHEFTAPTGLMPRARSASVASLVSTTHQSDPIVARVRVIVNIFRALAFFFAACTIESNGNRRQRNRSMAMTETSRRETRLPGRGTPQTGSAPKARLAEFPPELSPEPKRWLAVDGEGRTAAGW